MIIKPKSLRKYIFKTQLILAVVVVFVYTILLNWYFVLGLDESNYFNLYQESESFVKAYDLDENTALPRSFLLKGYIGWQQVPDEIKVHFPSLEHINELEMEDISFFDTEEYDITDMYFMLAQPLSDGKIFYLTQKLDLRMQQNQMNERLDDIIILTAPLALGFLLLILGSVYLMLRRLTKPMRELGSWADALTLDNSNKLPPDFSFDELNRIAKRQQDAFIRVREVLEKEHDFLLHASHELRTPIAVIKSNSELLERMLKEHKGDVSVKRIKRAVLNMQHMTETLLWLSRDESEQDDKYTGLSNVNIPNMIEQLIEDNQYLLQGKSVDIQLELDDLSVKVLETPCRLILNNLIRNAFQYTAEGDVIIIFKNLELKIENINYAIDEIDHTGSDYGYGLGLRLVDRIIQKVNWQYQNVEIPGGRKVVINFS